MKQISTQYVTARPDLYTIIIIKYIITLYYNVYVLYRGRRASVTAERYNMYGYINNSATPPVNGVTANETLFTTQPVRSDIIIYYIIM